MELRPVDAATAKEFIRRWHYARSASGGALYYGWFADADSDELLGASIYNTGFRDMQEGVFGPEHASRVIHHHRLAISEDARSRGIKTSHFILACNRQIQMDRPDIWAVVTYADTTFGNDGIIYRATNALFTGVQSKGNLYFETPKGEFRTVSKGLGATWPERRAEAARRGWAEKRSAGRNRYVYILGNKGERKARRLMLKWPVLPYSEISITPRPLES